MTKLKKVSRSNRAGYRSGSEFFNKFGMPKKAVLAAIVTYLSHKHPNETFDKDTFMVMVNDVNRKLWDNELTIDDLLAVENN